MATSGVKLNLDTIREVQVANLRPGDRVTILIPAGQGRNGQEWKEATGRAVICSGTHVTLNMGGRYGTPAVCTPRNFVRYREGKH